MTVRVDYGGPGGVCRAVQALGLPMVGIEWDRWACATRAAAGHPTIQADLATYRPHHQPGSITGYCASPPCQTFSSAGKGDGRAELDRLGETIVAERWGDVDLFDDRTRHVIDTARTAITLRPEWIALEQVPAVLPLWAALAHILHRHGYSTWHGILNAADYGVPQTRRRAFLMASRTSCVHPPVPTHAEDPTPTLIGTLEPWVTMAQALGWEDTIEHQRGEGMADRHGDRTPRTMDEPAPTITGGAHRRLRLNPGRTATQPNRRTYDLDEPAPTVAFGNDAASWVWERSATTTVGSFSPDTVAAPGYRGPGDGPRQNAPGSVRITLEEALILQGFPADYPVQGPKGASFQQVGNAVPPPLAYAVLSALTGADANDTPTWWAQSLPVAGIIRRPEEAAG